LGVRYWVIVKAPRYPERNTNPPSNITDIKESNSLQEGIGYLASVTVASADDPFDPREKRNGNFAPPLSRASYVNSLCRLKRDMNFFS
jgi:hypothetical protein